MDRIITFIRFEWYDFFFYDWKCGKRSLVEYLSINKVVSHPEKVLVNNFYYGLVKSNRTSGDVSKQGIVYVLEKKNSEWKLYLQV